MRSFTLIIFSLYFTLSYTQDSTNADAFTFEASYSLDGFANFSGGIKKGAGALGIIDIALSINLEDLGMWKGGSLYTQVENTHGSVPSCDFVGDMQTFDNMDNGDNTALYMLWYKQEISKLGLTLGIHDLNSEFLASGYGGNFINSSFGVIPTASMNLPLSIFPKNALGGLIQYDFSDKFRFQTAVYDGDPGSFEDDRYNTKWKLSKNEGLLSITELNYKTIKNAQTTGSYKLGFIYHTANFILQDDSSKTHSGNTSFYAIIDQMFLPEKDDATQGLGGFLQLGYAPPAYNFNDFHVGGGVCYNGLLSKKGNDVLGLAFTLAHVSNKVQTAHDSHETAIELFYTLTINDHISIQPDFQYIINPGTSKELNNAFVGLVRISMGL